MGLCSTGLFTDIDQLNLLQSLWEHDVDREAVCEVSISHLPPHRGFRIAAVRLLGLEDGQTAKSIRSFLDGHGFRDVKIYLSGNLDEHGVAQQIASKAPVDGFFLGASVVTSSDVPVFSMRYHIQEYDGKPQSWFVHGKWTYPCAKQIYRSWGQDGAILHDKVTVEDDYETGAPLLIPVMAHGRRLAPRVNLFAIRDRTKQDIFKCPKARLFTRDDQHDPVEQCEVLKSIARFVSRTPVLTAH